ncbi:uncharacterized protein [Henckelia pumila]|uniref:uncharacterized protein n=1 Tax=Henckelia pumila TaxID=405737 RepID=UPI003C6E70D4
MYRRLQNGYISDEYINGVEDFMIFALSHVECLSAGKVRCPCNHKKCQNKVFLDENTVKEHLGRSGFVPNYYNWHLHGEEYIRPNFPNTNPDVPSSSRSQNRRWESENIHADHSFHSHDQEYFLTNQNLGHEIPGDYQEEGPSQYVDPNIDHVESPNNYIKGLYELIKSAEKEIWDGNPHGHSLLSVLARLLKMKHEHNMSERNFNDMVQLMSELCPADNHMPDSFYSTKKLIKDLGLPRYKLSRRRGIQNNKKQTPYKRMYYFPITPRLQRLYASTATASHMRWHHDHHFDMETMTHPSDSPAWRHFDETHPWFAAEIRNVRLGLSTDGFQPFGQTGQQYSSWPVILTPYNLPPWMCMKDEVMFLSVIAPGPSNPKDKLDVFLQPLIAELQELWYDGAATYDIHSQTNFTMRAALMWTISDFPAYAMLSGWSTAGKQACPYCMSDSEAFTLAHSGKTSWFDNHRKFLPDDHRLRRKKNMFVRGRIVLHPAPAIRTGTELLNDIDAYGFIPSYNVDSEIRNREICHLARCGWRRRSILWELPYWRTNLIRHNLDVMHIEKNVFDNVFNTIMNVPGRTKDNAKSRADLVEMRIRTELHPDVSTGRHPKASYTLERSAREVLCRWLKDVRFSDGYASNMSRCVNMNKLRMFGMKSHDCHVFMQRLIPVAFKELLPREVWEALTELSLFFADLTARNIKQSDMMRLHEQIPIILCKLEKIFPPSFFDCMEHLCVHLPHEARIAGPVKFRWMYPFERFLRRLKSTVRNKACVEGSICNAYLVSEASIFCEHYFGDSIQTRQRKTRCQQQNIVNEIGSELFAIFMVRGRHIGSKRPRLLSNEEYHVVATYVLLNCVELKSYVSIYENQIRAEIPEISNQDLDSNIQANYFGWFKSYIRAIEQQGEFVSELIKQVALVPMRKVNTYIGYCINGFKFYTVHDTTFKATDNLGVQVRGHSSDGVQTEYYDFIEEIIELEYPGLPLKQTVIFKCCWYNPHPRLGTRVHRKYKIFEVNRTRHLPTNEPFVFATQASQVVFLQYPTSGKTPSAWLYVSGLRQRAYVADIVTENNVQTDATSAFQNNESQVHEVETQFLLNSENLVDATVNFDDEIDALSTDSGTEDVQESSEENFDVESD